jgi:hypothetical protein
LRPCENSLADFCSFALPKVLKINLLNPKKAIGQAFRSVEVQITARKFSHGLDLRMNPPVDLYINFEKSSWKTQFQRTEFLAYKIQL